MAVLLIVEPIFEADFLNCSYGFRPGHSAHQALEEIRQSLQQGRQEVYDADLQSYFDTIPHEKLMACVQKRIVDGSVLPAKLPARFKLTPERVEAFLADLAPFALHVSGFSELYENPVDRDDSHYINLAAASGADLITSRDDDLLRLMDETRPESLEFRRLFPRLQILPPDQVLKILRRARP